MFVFAEVNTNSIIGTNAAKAEANRQAVRLQSVGVSVPAS